MTLDKSLKIKAGSSKQRNVLNRAERLAKLKETERWKDGDPAYGLPKVRVDKTALKKKKKVKKEGEEGAAAPTIAGTPAAKKAEPAKKADPKKK